MGRAIWWDKEPQDLALRATMDEGRVPQPPYVYQTKCKPSRSRQLTTRRTYLKTPASAREPKLANEGPQRAPR